ncbi:MAG: tyrosine-type recombinase/integrase, partial [Cyanobacteria bacterium P01_D01_bin.128]
IRDWLLQTYSAETARRTLQQFNACCQWAYESQMLNYNPFIGTQRHIRKPKPSGKNWVAFTADERDRIIATFEVDKDWLAPWVKFLFWTGCRPEEAAALRWRHVARDNSEMMIEESFRADMPEAQPTKNSMVTRFPCNNRLQRLLREQRPDDWGREDFVFAQQAGSRFHYTNFQRRHWRSLVISLVESGDVAVYLGQYHCRHTWITLALEHMSVPEVSYLARVTPGILMKHYVGRSRKIVIPEF